MLILETQRRECENHMQQDENKCETVRGNFYSYPGIKPTAEPNSPELPPDPAPDTPAEEPAPPAPAPGDMIEIPAQGNTRRKKLLSGLLFTVLLAACLCGAGYLLQRFATASPAGAASGGTPVSGVNATLYLKSMAWEKKSHDTLKPLTKMKNLRYALQFFANFPPDQIAAANSAPSSISAALQNYKEQVGTLVSMNAFVEQKVAVTEEIEAGSGTPSILLQLTAPGASGDASMLVVGSTLDDVKAGDKISFRCIPLYCYAPKDSEGGVFLITAPELVVKTQAH